MYKRQDYVDVDPSIYPVYSSNPELKDQMHGFQPTGNYSLLMNCKTYPDAKVREAIALSVDRAAICDSILHGTATVPTSYIPAEMCISDSGVWGTLAVGLFATTSAPGNDTLTGLFYGGGFQLLGLQILGVVSVCAWTAVTITLTFLMIKATVGLRVSCLLYTSLCPGNALTFVILPDLSFTNFPIRGPSILAPMSAERPPTIWMAQEPAKSWNPICESQPPPQIQ